MKIKTFLKSALLSAVALTAVSCSQDIVSPDLMEAEEANGETVYKMVLNCAPVCFDGTETRATSTSWANNSKVYLKFGTVTGTATYSSSTGDWTVTASVSGTSGSVEAAYIEQPLSTSGSTVSMNENSVLYKGTGTYTKNGTTIYVNVTLKPQVWRMRFKGASGKSITLPADGNAISYVSSFNTSSFTASTAKKDIKLTVQSSGATPYIYGVFGAPTGNNDMKLVIDGEDGYYTRTVKGSSLTAGMSGYLNLPTSSNDYGWTHIGGTPAPSVPDYSKDMGKTLSNLSSLYGEPFIEVEHEFCNFYLPAANDDMSEFLVYEYNYDNQVYLIRDFLKEASADVVSYFNSKYNLVSSGTQYKWRNGSSSTYTMEIIYDASVPVIVYQSNENVVHWYIHKWRSMGTARYDEPFFCGGIFTDLSATVYDVEVMEDVKHPGIYQLVAPYGSTRPFLPTSLIDTKSNHNIVIFATDPNYVYIPEQWTGVTLGEDKVYASDIVGRALNKGMLLETIKESVSDEYFGKKSGNTITYAAKTLVTHFGTSDDEYYYANQSRAFVLNLPGTPVNNISRDEYGDDVELQSTGHKAIKQKFASKRNARRPVPMAQPKEEALKLMFK